MAWYKVRFGETNDNCQMNYNVSSEDEAICEWKKSSYNNGRNKIFSVSLL
jgi:hypothetical protein